MSWKNLVVFGDASPAGLARISCALDIAAHTQAHVEAVAFASPPLAPPGLELAAIGAVYAEITEASRREAQQTTLAMQARDCPVQLFSARVETAADTQLAERAAVAAFGADLVVASRPEKDGREEKCLHGALLRAGAPCLVLPAWAEAHKWGKRALIAWKETPQAARALRAAIPLLARAEHVRLLVVDPTAEASAGIRETVEHVATRLLRHGVTLEAPVLMESNMGEVGRAIADEAEGYGADFIVMGAYKDAPVVEWALGGVTRHMLQHMRTPLLLSH